MKKTLSILLAAATLLAACTKSEIAYEQPQEIGFNVVANNLTKSAVVNNSYPTELDMIVSAWNDNAATTDVTEYVEYFTDVTFGYKQQVTLNGTTKNAWGGKSEPQYWPNVNTLCFMGISASTNVSADNVVMYPVADGTNAANTIAISSYTQPEPTANNNGADDLMWFPLTAQYGKKGTVAVPVTMYHALSLLKFQVQGEGATGVTTSTYKVTDITINGINKQGSVVLGGANHSATWTLSATETKSDLVVYNNTTGVALSGTCVVDQNGNVTSQTAKVAENVTDGILVLPQTPTTIDITYEYTSSAGKTISETVEGLQLALTDGASWDDGYKYIYTITIKANEILIAPTPEAWADGNAGTVTVE